MTKNEFKLIFDTLKGFTDPKNALGMNRLAYSEWDQQAHQFMIDTARCLGLDVRVDAIGNVFARLEGAEPQLPAVASGSHLDTVPQGGAFDGIAGVVAALYAAAQYKKGQLKRSLEVIMFRAEESSRFGFACMGSKVLTGKADLDKWQKVTDSQGINYIDALAACGYDATQIDACKLPDNYLHAFVEMHIEQGKVLEHNNARLGVVTGIAAPSRYRIDIKGHADHSGATPMNQRHDALVAAASIITAIHTAASVESAYGTVGTVGKLDVTPNSMNVIPGDVCCFVDIRGIDADSIKRVIKKLHANVEFAAKQYDVEIEVLELSQDMPVPLSSAVIAVIEKQCAASGAPYMKMMSGAGHDAMYMAQHYPTGMIFIPSKEGVSHHPDEWTDFADVELGAEVLTKVLAELANQ